MEMELFEALRSAGVFESCAHDAVGALRAEFDHRESRLVSRVEFAEFKSDVAREFAQVHIEIAELRGEMRGEIGELRGEIGDLRGETRAGMAALKSELIKWIVALFIAQTGATGALLGLLH
jgi:hypothetical protein